MATNIVTPFAADEVFVTSARAKCISIANAWLGAGSTSGVSTWGDYHALINPVLTAASLTTITDGITGQQWMDRMNALNNAQAVVTGFGALGWWDAERADLLTLSGASVTTWTDSIGGYAATQAVGGAKPQYSATSFNSRPGVTFDGSDDELTRASQPFPSLALASEIWCLVDQTALAADTANRRVISYGSNASSASRWAERLVSGGVNRGRGVIGDGVSVGGSGIPDVDFSGKHILRIAVAPTTSTAYVDGGAGSAGAVVPATGATRTRLGASTADTPAAFWQGPINSILVTSALAAGAAGYLTNLLKARGGIA